MEQGSGCLVTSDDMVTDPMFVLHFPIAAGGWEEDNSGRCGCKHWIFGGEFE